MNLCSNDKCKKELYKHNLFCYECGYKSTNPVINDISRPILKRKTYLYCHSCLECIETYDDKKCRNCGIKLLSYFENNDIFSNDYVNNQIKKYELSESTQVNNEENKT